MIGLISTWLVEQFIEDRWSQHPNRPSIHSAEINAAPVLLHGHCHQKALWGIESSSKLLKRVLGDRLHIIDSGCCGMAGSFGYSANHYDVSMKIGELSLFGPIRNAPNATILAPGTSCRQQIHDGVGRDAKHPIELIHHALEVSA